MINSNYFKLYHTLLAFLLTLALEIDGKLWFDYQQNKLYHANPTVLEKSSKCPLQSFLLLASAGKILALQKLSLKIAR